MQFKELMISYFAQEPPPQAGRFQVSCLTCDSLLLISFFAHSTSGNEKLCVPVLTNIENEPDDAQSFIRFLTYSNQWVNILPELTT